jgi:hypothetical protein
VARTRSVGRFGRENLLAGGMGVGGVDAGLAAAVGGAQCDDGGGEQEGRAGQQGALETCGERGIPWSVRGEQRAGACGGDGGEDRQPERGTQLLGGVQQAGGEPGLVLGDAALAAVVTETRTAPIPIAMIARPGSRFWG